MSLLFFSSSGQDAWEVVRLSMKGHQGGSLWKAQMRLSHSPIFDNSTLGKNVKVEKNCISGLTCLWLPELWHWLPQSWSRPSLPAVDLVCSQPPTDPQYSWKKIKKMSSHCKSTWLWIYGKNECGIRKWEFILLNSGPLVDWSWQLQWHSSYPSIFLLGLFNNKGHEKVVTQLLGLWLKLQSSLDRMQQNQRISNKLGYDMTLVD